MPTPITIVNLPLRRAIVATGFQTQQKLVHHKAILEQNGITNLSTLGKLRLGGGVNVIPTPGILTPPTAGANVLGAEFQLSRVNVTQVSRRIGFPSDIPVQRAFLRAHQLISRPFRTQVLTFAASVPIPLAYWVADEVEITDGTKVVFTSICEELYIVANKVKLGTNVEFTWQEPSDHSRAKTKLPSPSQPRQTRRPDSEDEVIHGTEKVNGRPGDRGEDGVNAPRLEIWTLDLEGRPIAIFRGQDGQPGQDGQDGSKGQNGADGISGKVAWTSIGGYWCERQAGSGGDGASGGNGGDGGDGGNGGKGGKFTMFAPQPILDRIAENGFHCDMTGGRAGVGGRGGRGGEGGEGGVIGRTERSKWPGGANFAVCGPKAGAKNGRDGSRGREGRDGRTGQDGTFYETSVRLTPINPNEFTQQLSKPAIQRIDKDQVTVGERITIEGRNFTNSDKVLFNEHEVTPSGVTSNTLLSVVVPSLDGGNVRVTIRQVDGTTSNPFTIVVKPNVTSIAQAGQVGNRFKPGQEIIIRGSGFNRDSIVFANDIQQGNVVFINNTELRSRLVRPFQIDEFPNAAGEPVSIKVKIPATKAGTVESNAFNIVLDTFRMLVLGDSIQWGQGLQDHQKIHRLVEDEIRSRAGSIGVYKSVFAHSGAIIGPNNNTTEPPIPGTFGGELNTPFPIIREQVLSALDGNPTDNTVDLILLDGGINDVDIKRILNPLDGTLDEKINEFCFGRMRELLEMTSRGFPNAKIIVTGYYRIVSNSTDGNLIGLVLMGFGLAVAGFPGVVGGIVLDAVTVDAIKDRCLRFRDRSHAQIRNAIAQTMTTVPGANGRIFFADPGFSDDNAIFAPNALIFGIDADLSPQDNDIVANGRAGVCAANPDRADPLTCPIASIGHPTPAGAERYAGAVIAQLRAAMPDLFI